MNQFTISLADARKIILHAGGLAKAAQFGKGKEGVYKLINHLGFVQIDTNYVVERAHHHAIASRVPDYKTEWLHQLQEEGRIFEFWTYAAGVIPMNDFRFSLPVKAAFLARRKAMTPADTAMMRTVLDRISREGPLMARDFENDRTTKSSGWWDWRPSKLALERLHLDGSLMAVRRKDFQKLYDLTENVLPADVDKTTPGDEEFSRHVIRRALKVFGIAYIKDIAYSSRYAKNQIKEVLAGMVSSGEVCAVMIKGLKDGPFYMLPEYKRRKITLSGDAFILSPFDVVNVLRHRLRNFFDFDYQVECFVPAAKRRYGYFSLPILIGDKFVARMDSKADRKHRTLIVNNLHFEPVSISKAMISKLSFSLKAFATFNQCDKIIVKKSNKNDLLKIILTKISA